MTERTCINCTFWDSITQECGKADWLATTAMPPEDSISHYADAADDSGLRAGVRTGPKFGCLQWEPV